MPSTELVDIVAGFLLEAAAVKDSGVSMEEITFMVALKNGVVDDDASELLLTLLKRSVTEKRELLKQFSESTALHRAIREDAAVDMADETAVKHIHELQRQLWILKVESSRLRHRQRSTDLVVQRIQMAEQSHKRLVQRLQKTQERIAGFSHGRQIQNSVRKSLQQSADLEASRQQVDAIRGSVSYWQELLQLYKKRIASFGTRSATNQNDVESILTETVDMEQQIVSKLLPKLISLNQILEASDAGDVGDTNAMVFATGQRIAKEAVLFKALDARKEALERAVEHLRPRADNIVDTAEGYTDSREADIEKAYNAARQDVSVLESEEATLRRTVEILERTAGDTSTVIGPTDGIESFSDIEKHIAEARERLRQRKADLAPLVQQLKDRRRECRAAKDDDEERVANGTIPCVESLERDVDAARKRVENARAALDYLEKTEIMYRDLANGMTREKLEPSIARLQHELNHRASKRRSRSADPEKEVQWWKQMGEMLTIALDASRERISDSRAMTLGDSTVLELP